MTLGSLGFWRLEKCKPPLEKKKSSLHKAEWNKHGLWVQILTASCWRSSLSLSFLICTMGIVILASEDQGGVTSEGVDAVQMGLGDRFTAGAHLAEGQPVRPPGCCLPCSEVIAACSQGTGTPQCTPRLLIPRQCICGWRQLDPCQSSLEGLKFGFLLHTP